MSEEYNLSSWPHVKLNPNSSNLTNYFARPELTAAEFNTGILFSKNFQPRHLLLIVLIETFALNNINKFIYAARGGSTWRNKVAPIKRHKLGGRHMKFFHPLALPGTPGSIREGQGKLFQVEERTGRVLCRKLEVNLSHFKKTCRLAYR